MKKPPLLNLIEQNSSVKIQVRLQDNQSLLWPIHPISLSHISTEDCLKLVCIKPHVKCHKAGTEGESINCRLGKRSCGQGFMNMHVHKVLIWGFFSLIEHLCILMDSHELCLIAFCRPEQWKSILGTYLLGEMDWRSLGILPIHQGNR